MGTFLIKTTTLLNDLCNFHKVFLHVSNTKSTEVTEYNTSKIPLAPAFALNPKESSILIILPDLKFIYMKLSSMACFVPTFLFSI